VVSVVRLGSLYTRYSRSVFRRARRILADDEGAKDITQEVFLRALRADASEGFATEPMAWLYRTTTNLCLNRLRDVKRRRELLAEWRPEENGALAAESGLTLREILERTPEELQDIAVYYYVDELSHDEIARIIGVSRRTIGNRLATFHVLMGEIVAVENAS
jgi:RNA polymerase sigma factor (sigma-70 family)